MLTRKHAEQLPVDYLFAIFTFLIWSAVTSLSLFTATILKAGFQFALLTQPAFLANTIMLFIYAYLTTQDEEFSFYEHAFSLRYFVFPFIVSMLSIGFTYFFTLTAILTPVLLIIFIVEIRIRAYYAWCAGYNREWPEEGVTTDNTPSKTLAPTTKAVPNSKKEEADNQTADNTLDAESLLPQQ